MVERISTEVTKGSLSNLQGSFVSEVLQARKEMAAETLGNRRSNLVRGCALNPRGIDTGYVVDITCIRLNVCIHICRLALC